MISKIAGKNQSIPPKPLIKNNTQVTNIKDIADLLSKFLLHKLQNRISQIQRQERKAKAQFSIRQHQKHNELFSLSELKKAIQRFHNSAVGPHEIHYEFLR